MKGKSSLIISVGVVAVAVLILIGLVTCDNPDPCRSLRCSSPEQIFDYARDVIGLYECTERLSTRCHEWVENGAVDSQEKQKLTALYETYEATHDCLRSGFARYRIACHNQLGSETSSALYQQNERYVKDTDRLLQSLRNSLSGIWAMLHLAPP